MVERWCTWHWPTWKPGTGMYCFEHLAEGHVWNCPYTAPGQVKQNYCGYKPWAPVLQVTGVQESAMGGG